ncbi:MAG TPA: sigma-70 family RNA polymerase sigma factor [Candidatus Nanoarchaeia archaeon]|nr:sigma-70 family RNA polymerase sigma factor [Candidatus Nanoarchaeia archaeon]
MANYEREPTSIGLDSLDIYFKEVKSSDNLSYEQERDLTRRIRSGDESAREELVVKNLRFVISVAREYRNLGLPLEDLIGCGNLGLMNAIQGFDETKGFKFISYAVFWIRQAILQKLAEERTVRVPLNQIDLYLKIKKQRDEYAKDNNGEEISLEELAQKTGSTTAKIEYALKATRTNLSLDAQFDEDGERNLYNLLASSETSPEQAAYLSELKEKVRRALSQLEQNEAEVISLYFGLEDGRDRITLEEIGKQKDLTRERVRQIKEKALKKLRHRNRGLHELYKEM